MMTRSSAIVVLVGSLLALLLGVASSRLLPAFIALLTLLPLLSHIRWVGFRRALTEPNGVTIIVLFYLFIFPLRGLVVAMNHNTDLTLVRRSASSTELIEMLLLASFATTILVEAYYFTLNLPQRQRHVASQSLRHKIHRADSKITSLGALLGGIALLGLLGVLRQYGGLGGAQSAFLSHSKSAALAGETGLVLSAWVIFAVPAVWTAALVVVNPSTSTLVRASFLLLGIVLLLAELVIFGSRLNAILALLGVWVVLYYTGHRISAPKILAVVAVLFLLSAPIISERRGGEQAGLSTIERDSRITGYGVLEATLAVRQEPDEIRARLSEPHRWLDLPGYLVPSLIWQGRPNINPERMDYIVANAIGTQNDKTTGFPTTYLLEAWLYAGWLGVLLVSVAFGAALGWLHRRLVGTSNQNPSYAALLSYSFVVTTAFSYYENGDFLGTFVGEARAVLYLGICLLVTGVWSPNQEPARSTDSDLPKSQRLPPGAAVAGIATVPSAHTSPYKRYRST